MNSLLLHNFIIFSFFLLLHISIVFPQPPPPPHFHCFSSTTTTTTTTTFLLFSLHHHHRHHISIVFPPPPPPPHFYCFPSTTTTTTTTFLLFSLHHHHHRHHISIVFPQKAKEAKIRPKRPNSRRETIKMWWRWWWWWWWWRENNRNVVAVAAGNRKCIITLRLSDFKSQTSLTLLLRQYELTNKNVSYFLTNQSKTKTFIDLKVTRKPKPTKNSTRPYLNGILAHFTHETCRHAVIKTKGYNVSDVNVFLHKLMKFLCKKVE